MNIDKLDFFRDPNFVFNEEAHTYHYMNPETGKPVQKFMSVTQFLSQFKKPFDSEMIAGVVAKSRTRKGEPTTKAQVLQEWKDISDIALKLGTNVHKWIEDYYNGKKPEVPTAINESERVQKFLEIYEERLYKLTAVSQEFRVFSRRWGIAGTMDILFWLDPFFYVGDWKTNKKFTTDKDPEGRKQKMLAPFQDMWDNSLNAYSVQISLYRLILKEEADFDTEGGFLVWIGPNGKPKLFKIVDLRDRLYDFLEKNNDNTL